MAAIAKPTVTRTPKTMIKLVRTVALPPWVEAATADMEMPIAITTIVKIATTDSDRMLISFSAFRNFLSVVVSMRPAEFP